MKTLDSGRYAVSISVAAAMLAACSGSQPPTGAPASSRYVSVATSPAHSKTFVFTGEAQSFTVPAGVRSLNVVARGAAGGAHCAGTGRGARVYAVIPVASEERLSVYVGGAAGFNGGGQGNKQGGGSGGGASDVRVGHARLDDRIVVAAGGGGTGGIVYCYSGGGGGAGAGGSGGGPGGGRGSDGMSYGKGSAGGGGSGGTQAAGGFGGPGGDKVRFCRSAGGPGSNGALGLGGSGGVVARHGRRAYPAGGGGGGGGYFGGGGGGSACDVHAGDVGGGGGGGGSSYVEPRAKNVRYWGNWKNANGNGLVVFSW